MKKTLIACLSLAALAIPATASAVNGQDKTNASRECRALRTAMGAQNFAQQYGKPAGAKNAFGKCVSQKARDEANERRAAHANAVTGCHAEQADQTFATTHDGKTFDQFYGTGKNGKNAFGKCVSQKARQNKQAADQNDQQVVNAARSCRSEQKDSNFAATHDNKSFADFYGTNASKRNAFGKCVSKKAKELQQQS